MSYKGRKIIVTPHWFAGGNCHVATEAGGQAQLRDDQTYQNCYLLIADEVSSRITQLREYYGALLVTDVTGL